MVMLLKLLPCAATCTVSTGFGAAAHRLASTSCLVLGESGGDGRISSATLSAMSAAHMLGGPITMLLAGQSLAAAAASAAQVTGVAKVLTADCTALQHQLAEPYAALIRALQHRHTFSHILSASSAIGKNVLPRAAALLDCQPISDAVHVQDVDTFVRPIHAGNALATARYSTPGLRMVTVRASAFTPATASSSASAPIEAVDPSDLEQASAANSSSSHQASKVQDVVPLSQWVGEDVRHSERPELGAAKAVVAGGRALKSADNFAMLERLADLLGGAVGASRAAVDAGYVANSLQVGQTGKIVAPDLYIGIGISGAIQHLAGMKDSKTIVAINNDGDAPIFEVADYGLVQDLFVAVPELIAALEALQGKSQ